MLYFETISEPISEPMQLHILIQDPVKLFETDHWHLLAPLLLQTYPPQKSSWGFRSGWTSLGIVGSNCAMRLPKAIVYTLSRATLARTWDCLKIGGSRNFIVWLKIKKFRDPPILRHSHLCKTWLPHRLGYNIFWGNRRFVNLSRDVLKIFLYNIVDHKQ